MPCSREDNRRSGVALAMRHRLQWFIHLRAHGLRKGDEHPAYTPHGVWHSFRSDSRVSIVETGLDKMVYLYRLSEFQFCGSSAVTQADPVVKKIAWSTSTPEVFP